MKSDLSAPGNTIAEYALILGLVLIASMGALGMFGGSLSGVFNESSKHIEDKTSYGIAWKNNENTQPGKKADSTSWDQRMGGLLQQFLGIPDNTKPDKWQGSNAALALLESNSVGTNATSADGSIIKQAPEHRMSGVITLLAQFENIVADMPEGPDKQWFLDAGQKGLLLAGAQASDEVVKKGSTSTFLVALADTSLNGNDVGYNIQTFKDQLQVKLTDMPPSMSPTYRTLGGKLVTGVLERLDAEAYETTYNPLVGVKPYGRTPQEIKKAGLETLANSGDSPETTAVQSTLTHAVSLDTLGH